jgi:hypothetical protein
MTAAGLESITDAIRAGDLRAYSGIPYNIEEECDAGLNQVFAVSFTAAKDAGFKVLSLPPAILRRTVSQMPTS